MQEVRITGDRATVNLSLNELLAIHQALNEVCNGLSLAEFQTRMGATREEVRHLMAEIGSAIDKVQIGLGEIADPLLIADPPGS